MIPGKYLFGEKNIDFIEQWPNFDTRLTKSFRFLIPKSGLEASL